MGMVDWETSKVQGELFSDNLKPAPAPDANVSIVQLGLDS